MNRPLLTFAAVVVALTACEGFKEAMSAHQDVVARAGSQELSSERLADLLGNSRIPVTSENVKTLADLWVNYQLLGQAAAKNDSLKDPKLVDEALWPMLAQQRANKWHEIVSKSWSPDTAASETKYNQGDMLAAQHILFAIPENGLSQHKKDSIKAVAEQVRGQVNAANFADLAKKYSMDPGSKDRGGSLGVFPRGAMVPEFEKALIALKPGEIAPGLVQSQFGYHIIRRPTFAEAKDDFARAAAQQGTQAAESTYLANLEKGGHITFKDGAAAEVKKVMIDPESYHKDNTVIATSKAGDFTAAKLAKWIGAFDPRQQAQMKARLQNNTPPVPDSVILNFVKGQFIRGELVLAQADSAHIKLDAKELEQVRSQFSDVVTRAWADLGVAPAVLKDSAKSESERERVAGSQVDKFIERLLNNQVAFVQVPQPVETVLREKYDWKVSTAGVQRAVDRANKVRAASDSLHAAERPQTQVPLQRPPVQGAQPGQPQPVQPVQPPPTQPAPQKGKAPVPATKAPARP